MKIKFTKMHGLGNDFVLIDARALKKLPWKEYAPKLLNRYFGIGADQLLVLTPSSVADATMLIFERDGLETEMCGNGIRCVARYLNESGFKKSEYTIETLGGIKVIQYESAEKVSVDMGKPKFGELFEFEGMNWITVSMGNPHAVLFVEKEKDLAQVLTLGPKIERHPHFQNRTNVEFVYPKSPSDLVVRVWERGAGETLACGTGACASSVAAIRSGKAKSPVNVHFQGGALSIVWKEGESVFMTGPTTRVFDAEVEI